MALLRLLLLPIRAPMLLVLLAVSLYLGFHWGLAMDGAGASFSGLGSLVWMAEGAQALVVVFFCSMPDLLVRRFSMMLAASRVVTLVATLLLVTIAGLYLLHLEVLSNVLILSTAVLLARLDLIRLRLAPPPLLLALMLSLLVLIGAGAGMRIAMVPLSQLLHWPGAPPRQLPAAQRRVESDIKRIPLFGRIGKRRASPPIDPLHSGEP